MRNMRMCFALQTTLRIRTVLNHSTIFKPQLLANMLGKIEKFAKCWANANKRTKI